MSENIEQFLYNLVMHAEEHEHPESVIMTS